MEEENHDSTIPLFPSLATYEVIPYHTGELDNLEQELQDALEQWWKQLVQEAKQKSLYEKIKAEFGELCEGLGGDLTWSIDLDRGYRMFGQRTPAQL